MIAEIGIRKRDIQGFRVGEMPWTVATGGGVIGQPATHTQLNQHCPAAALCSPLPPQRSPKATSNPASKVHQQIGRFAESEIATPAPHIWSELRSEERRVGKESRCPGCATESKKKRSKKK